MEHHADHDVALDSCTLLSPLRPLPVQGVTGFSTSVLSQLCGKLRAKLVLQVGSGGVRCIDLCAPCGETRWWQVGDGGLASATGKVRRVRGDDPQ